MKDALTLFFEARYKWGQPSQLVMGLEETAELQKEICKVYRGDISDERLNKLAEEIADVRLMTEQLENMYGLTEQIQQWRLIKLERLAKLLLAEGKDK